MFSLPCYWGKFISVRFSNVGSSGGCADLGKVGEHAAYILVFWKRVVHVCVLIHKMNIAWVVFEMNMYGTNNV